MLKHYYAEETQHIIAPVVLKENPISLLTKKNHAVKVHCQP